MKNRKTNSKDFQKIIYLKIKSSFDFIFSLFGIILLLPLFLIIAILIKLDSKGPIIFKQNRLGKNGKIFEIYKFRSMIIGAETIGAGGRTLNGDNRITRVGKFIRATSIDELPQLINILKGEMSFIGPRPFLTYDPLKYEDYTKEQSRRFEVLPGITGLAQINGRKDLDWNKRFEYDIKYVDSVSFILDLKIFFKTFLILAKHNY